MSHLDEKLLQKIIDNAKEKIQIGGIYRHYKKGERYKVIGVGIIEGTDKVGVIYEAQYGKKIVWIREIDSFNGKVREAGKEELRFELI